MRASRLALIVLGLATLVALVPLAHISPPDPTWLPGVWDNGDYDDIVALVTSDSSLVGAGVDSQAGCLSVVLGSVRDVTIGIFTDASLLPDCPRAPPTA